MNNKILSLTIASIIASTAYAQNDNTIQLAIEGDSSNITDNSKTVQDSVKATLGSYYLDSPTSDIEVVRNDTDWVPLSAPFNCTPWVDIGGGQEERDCDIREARILNEKSKDSTNSGFLTDSSTQWVERVSLITQRRSAPVAPAPTPSPSFPAPVSGVQAYLNNVPATAGLNESFSFDWDSYNALSCSVTDQSSTAASGTGSTRFGTLGTNTITATCTDGVDSATATDTIEIVAVPMSITLNAPATVNFGQNYTIDWDSVGASSCSVNGGSLSSSLISGSQSRLANQTGTITTTITCTNGTDTITETANTTIVMAPPANGACTYGSTLDNTLNLQIPRYKINSYGRITRYTTGSANTYLPNNSHDRVANRYNNIRTAISSSGVRFGEYRNSYGYISGNSSNGSRDRCYRSGSRTYYYYYVNSYACDAGRMYLTEVTRVCSPYQYHNRTWYGRMLMVDYNNL
jgi:hypothetical protein